MEPTGINGYIFQLFNSLAGRSWLFDSIASLILHNGLVKAAIIGSCFLAVWYGKETPDETRRVRKILLATIIAAFFALPTTQLMSHIIFLPRPIDLSHRMYHLEEENLVEYEQIAVRVPLDDLSQKKYQNFLSGEIDLNDLGAFPSDHAGFFVAISLGILFAGRRAGLIALGWTCFFILASKLIFGEHTPADIAAGAGIGIAWLLLCQYLAGKRPGRLIERVSNWTLKHNALSSAILFAVMFEVSSMFEHVKPLVKLAAIIGKRVLGAGE
jgi:membrane-associated phospholipid phosphatase